MLMPTVRVTSQRDHSSGRKMVELVEHFGFDAEVEGGGEFGDGVAAVLKGSPARVISQRPEGGFSGAGRQRMPGVAGCERCAGGFGGGAGRWGGFDAGGSFAGR